MTPTSCLGNAVSHYLRNRQATAILTTATGLGRHSKRPLSSLVVHRPAPTSRAAAVAVASSSKSAWCLLRAGVRHRLVFVERLVATLMHLQHGLLHAALGLLFGVDRSTITRATGEIRGLLAERWGCAVPGRPDLNATEVQIFRPPASRGERRASCSV